MIFKDLGLGSNLSAKESYGIGTDDNDEQPNVWAPDSVFPGFRTFVLDFHTECWQVAQNVLHALSIGLGLKDEEFLLKFHEQKENELSLRHYPPIDEESIRSGKLDRLGAHTDFDSFTLLWQDEVGGLEVKDKNGKWIDVPAVEGALVMNIGDVLQRWSNGTNLFKKRRGRELTASRLSHLYSSPSASSPSG